MPIATRVITTLLWNGAACVKGKSFKNYRQVGSIRQAIKVCELRNIDELILLDLSPTAPRLKEVAELCSELFMPVTLGGGITSLVTIEELLRAGADKVAICSQATPDFIWEASRTFGAQAIVAVINAVRNLDFWEVNKGGRRILIEPDRYAVNMAEAGAGEILLQSVDQEGKMEGYDTDLIRSVAQAVNVPVIASGGCGSYPDMLGALKAGAHAVAAGALFLFTESTPAVAAEFLAMNGYHTRTKETLK